MSSRKIVDSEESNGWITTFADLMTLLLVFFVLLFSMSTLEKERFASTVQSFQLAISTSSGGSIIPLPEELRVPATELPESLEDDSQPLQIQPEPIILEDEKPRVPEVLEESERTQELEYMSNSLKDVFSTMGVKDVVEVGEPKDGKIRIRVKGSVLFNSGDAAFKRQMMPILDGLLDRLEENPEFQVDIQGHTDNVPIETVQFPSNWELSAVRATTVLRYMVRGGIDPERLTATGYGDSLPIGPNNTPEQRADNRRIEFVLEKSQK